MKKDVQNVKGKFWRSARLPGRGDAAALAVLALAAFFLWNHPDIQETAQHVHILLDDLFSGQFFDFYEHTMQARQAYGFANAGFTCCAPCGTCRCTCWASWCR